MNLQELEKLPAIELIKAITDKFEQDDLVKNVIVLAALSTMKDVASSIPEWAAKDGRGGSWFAEQYGFTGAMARLDSVLLEEAGLTLPSFIDVLVKLTEVNAEAKLIESQIMR